MKDKRNILLTFDHELFLGQRSGDIDSCMIQPTKALQSLFNDQGIKKAIFFIDTTYLACLKRNFSHAFCKRDYEVAANNVRYLLENGHYVFPHIHPHWLNAELKDENWVLTNLSKYAFKNCNASEKEQVWKESMEILNEFKVNDFHEIDGFRSGGWCSQPFSDFKPFFEQYGIKHDFTVMPNTYSWTDAQQYDYTSVNSTLPYRFEDDIIIAESKGSFLEIPISIRNKEGSTIRERILMKYLWKTGNRSLGKGNGVIPKLLDYTPDKKPKDVQMISIELMHALNLGSYKDHLNQNKFVHFISHPKMLSPHNLKCFKNSSNMLIKIMT